MTFEECANIINTATSGEEITKAIETMTAGLWPNDKEAGRSSAAKLGAVIGIITVRNIGEAVENGTI